MKLSLFTSAILYLFISVGQAVAQPPDNFSDDSTEQVFNNARIIVGDGSVIERIRRNMFNSLDYERSLPYVHTS